MLQWKEQILVICWFAACYRGNITCPVQHSHQTLVDVMAGCSCKQQACSVTDTTTLHYCSGKGPPNQASPHRGPQWGRGPLLTKTAYFPPAVHWLWSLQLTRHVPTPPCFAQLHHSVHVTAPAAKPSSSHATKLDRERVKDEKMPALQGSIEPVKPCPWISPEHTLIKLLSPSTFLSHMCSSC